ncbi:MAG: methyltransferase domain-containing protein [Steroidobacteraceae bacterium]
MSDTAIAAAGRFHSAAPHYLSGRPPYSPALLGRVAMLCGLARTHRVLDLGCGPAQLSVAFAPLVAEVVAIDPEPAMLHAAAENMARAGVSVRLIEGRAEDLSACLGAFRMAVIGRAFHWMERARVLARLDEHIEPAGAVVLFGSRHPETADNAWLREYRQLLERYAVDDADRAERHAPGWHSHETVLLDSPFARLERISVIERRRTLAEALLDRAFSMSSTAPGRLGDRAETLAREMHAFAATHSIGGFVTEMVETDALIAHRPEAAAH